MIGTQISHYRVLKPLGRGGMGEVYLAEDLTLPRRVALKFLSGARTSDEERLGRFEREARAIARIDHPGVVTVYEAGRHEGAPFLAMQYVEGETLEERLARGPLDVAEAVRVAIEVADVLSEVHALGIVHRDLKPSNIIVAPKGRVRLFDFGIASLRGSSALTRTGSVAGTLEILAPEQVKGGSIDGRVDLWALGVLLYRALTGKPPFSGESPERVLYAIVNDAPDAPMVLRPEIPPDLDHAVRKLLRKDPAHRYQRADEVLADLRATIAGPAPPAESENGQRERRLAVLYFEVLSENAEDAYLAAGLTEDLIVDLTRVSGLDVVPRSEVRAYRGRPLPARTVARELEVDFVLTGSVRRQGARARVTVELVRGIDGQLVWSERFDRTVGDLFDVQTEVSRRIAEALAIRLSPSDRAILEKPPTKNDEAYRLLLRARELLDQETQDGARRAIELLKSAIGLDSEFAQAHAVLADAYAQSVGRWWTGCEASDRAIEHARLALALEPDLREAHIALCRAYRNKGDNEATLRHGRRALELSPDCPDTLEAVGWAFATGGDPESARPLFERLLELRPDCSTAWTWLLNTLKMLPDRAAERDSRERFIESAARVLRRDPSDALTRSRLAAAYADLGQNAAAVEQGERAVELSPHDSQIRYNFACVLARVGEPDRAIETLRAAVKGLEGFSRTWYLKDPDLAALHGHPEFHRLFGPGSGDERSNAPP